MELRQWIAFKQVAELRSFTKAAEALSLTQPTISYQIRLLEEELGQPLFETVGRRARLTPAGEMFLPTAEKFLNAVEEAKGVVDRMNAGEEGRVSIAAIGSSTVYVLPELLYQFGITYPHIETRLRTAGGDEIRNMVKNNQVDLGILGSHVSVSDFASLRLFQDEIVPFVHARHPLAKKRKVTFAQLAREPLIQLGTWKSWQNYVLSIFRQVGVTPTIRLQLDSIDAVKRMVERGLGFAIIPHTAAQDEVAEGKLVKLRCTDVPPLIRDVLLIHRKQKVFSKAQERFIEFLRESSKKLRV
jgi:DNA-binding transcriptional LysR family regulator